MFSNLFSNENELNKIKDFAAIILMKKNLLVVIISKCMKDMHDKITKKFKKFKSCTILC